MMKCKKCGHEGDPITSVEPFPGKSVQVDREDPDYPEHQHGLDVDGNVQIGLEICRNCRAINGFWIEDAGDAEFHSDGGKDRPALPTMTDALAAGDGLLHARIDQLESQLATQSMQLAHDAVTIECLNDAVAAEREACAKVCDRERSTPERGTVARYLGERIRERSNAESNGRTSDPTRTPC